MVPRAGGVAVEQRFSFFPFVLWCGRRGGRHKQRWCCHAGGMRARRSTNETVLSSFLVRKSDKMKYPRNCIMLCHPGRQMRDDECTYSDAKDTIGKPIVTEVSSANNDGEKSNSEVKSSRKLIGIFSGDALDAEVVAIALPALGALAIDPFLSVVDAVYIGKLGPSDLGGMGVASAIFTFTFRTFNFLCTVTGPLVASSVARASNHQTDKNSTPLEHDVNLENSPDGIFDLSEARKTVRSALLIAVVAGTILSSILLSYGDEALSLAGVGDRNKITDRQTSKSSSLNKRIGDDRDVLDRIETFDITVHENDRKEDISSGGENALLSPAKSYLKFRTISLPFVLINTVAIGSFRGLLDTKTPLKVAIIINVLNFTLDPLLIFGIGQDTVGFGVGGAAMATTFSEMIGTIIFVKLMYESGLLVNKESNSSEDLFEFKGMKELALGGASQFVRTILLQFVLLRAATAAAALDSDNVDAINKISEAYKPVFDRNMSSNRKNVQSNYGNLNIMKSTSSKVGPGQSVEREGSSPVSKSVQHAASNGIFSASYQVVLQVWWISLFCLDSIAVAGQGLIASALNNKADFLLDGEDFNDSTSSNGRQYDSNSIEGSSITQSDNRNVMMARTISDRLLLYGCICGFAIMVILLFNRDSLASAFSDDMLVKEIASRAIVIVALLQPLNGLVFVGDGLFQGALDFSYLAISMAFASASALLVLNLKVDDLNPINGGDAMLPFTLIWISFAVLQVGRAAGLGFRYYNTMEAGPLALRGGRKNRYH